MSPPVSHTERGNPPPRRKSCLACVKSKRRCDQALPSCLRCEYRRIPCEYPSRIRQNSLARSLQNIQHAPAKASSKDKDGGHRELICEMAGDESWLTLDDPIPCPPSSWMDANIPLGLGEGPSLDFQTTSEWPSVMPLSDFMPAADGCYGPVIPTGYVDVDWISSKMSHSLAYAIEKIKNAPSTMLLKLQVPWSHESLYKDEVPRVMQGQCCTLQRF